MAPGAARRRPNASVISGRAPPLSGAHRLAGRQQAGQALHRLLVAAPEHPAHQRQQRPLVAGDLLELVRELDVRAAVREVAEDVRAGRDRACPWRRCCAPDPAAGLDLDHLDVGRVGDAARPWR